MKTPDTYYRGYSSFNYSFKSRESVRVDRKKYLFVNSIYFVRVCVFFLVFDFYISYCPNKLDSTNPTPIFFPFQTISE